MTYGPFLLRWGGVITGGARRRVGEEIVRVLHAAGSQREDSYIEAKDGASKCRCCTDLNAYAGTSAAGSMAEKITQIRHARTVWSRQDTQ